MIKGYFGGRKDVFTTKTRRSRRNINVKLRVLGNCSCITHRDVGAAIAPGNLAAFPPSLEVNAEE
jgi:hypothetical protein